MANKLWNKDYILLLQGSAVSTLGDLMYSVAIGCWVYEKTGSSSLMGIMSAISMFVTMFISPFSGSIVDKCNRKWVMVGMDLLQSVVMLTVGILAFMDKLNIMGVLIAAFLAAFGTVFYYPAASTLMIDIIPHDDMVRGQSIFAGMSSLVNMIGTAFSGVMVAFFGVPLIVIFNGLSNLYSAITELFVHVPKTVRQGNRISMKNILQDSKTAIKTICSDACLRIFIPCALILNLLSAGPMSLILPFCMNKGFTVDMYGYLMAVWLIAALVCSLLLGAVKFKSGSRFWIMAVGFSFSVVFLSVAYMSKRFLPMCIFTFLGAFLNCAGNTIFKASMMLALPEDSRGAILGIIESAAVGGTAVSAVLYGMLGDVFPLHLVFTAGSLVSLLPMLYFCFNPVIKRFVLEH